MKIAKNAHESSGIFLYLFVQMAGQGAKKLKAANATTVRYLAIAFALSYAVHVIVFLIMGAVCENEGRKGGEERLFIF